LASTLSVADSAIEPTRCDTRRARGEPAEEPEGEPEGKEPGVPTEVMRPS
jgi:hypothetical protein